MSTMERVPDQLEVSQHVQKICAPLIILSSQYLLSKTFTNIKVYVQRLANLCQLLWCHSCLWGWSGSPDIDEQTKQRELKWYLQVVQLWKWTKWALAKQREPKIITKRYLKVIPAHRIVLSSSSGFFRDLLLKYVKNKITYLQINTAWTILQENKIIYYYPIIGWFSSLIPYPCLPSSCAAK